MRTEVNKRGAVGKRIENIFTTDSRIVITLEGNEMLYISAEHYHEEESTFSFDGFTEGYWSLSDLVEMTILTEEDKRMREKELDRRVAERAIAKEKAERDTLARLKAKYE